MIFHHFDRNRGLIEDFSRPYEILPQELSGGQSRQWPGAIFSLTTERASALPGLIYISLIERSEQMTTDEINMKKKPSLDEVKALNEQYSEARKKALSEGEQINNKVKLRGRSNKQRASLIETLLRALRRD